MALPHSIQRLSPKQGRPLTAVQRLGLYTIDEIRHNPLDVFSRLATAENYDRERLSLRELHLSLPGDHTDHHITFSWSPGDEMLQLFLVFEGKLPGGRSADICRMLSLLNERLSAGHFDYWSKDDALVYRHSIRLSGEARLNMDQAMAILDDAQRAAETGYPALQFMIWAGLTPEEALDQALIARASEAQ